MNALMWTRARACVLAVMILATLGGCESMDVTQLNKRIDYKSAGSGPSLELPPDLTTPQYDDRYAVTSASEFAAKNANRPKQAELLPVGGGDVRIVRAGTEPGSSSRPRRSRPGRTCARSGPTTASCLPSSNPPSV